jgi:hypothetical protein
MLSMGAEEVTPEGTCPSDMRVYQFRHFGTSRIVTAHIVSQSEEALY